MAPQVGKDRAWLGKVRPWWNHHYHFHVRLACPPGMDGCENQKAVAGDDGCGQELDQLVCHAEKGGDRDRQAARPGAKPWVGKPPLTMAQLPKECAHGAHRRRLRAADPGEGRHPRRQRRRRSPRSPPRTPVRRVPVLTPAQFAALTGDGPAACRCPTATPCADASRQRPVSGSIAAMLERRANPLEGATQCLWRAPEKLLRPAADRFLPHRLLSYRA